MKKDDKENQKIIDEYDYLSNAASSQDCTGLIPSGPVSAEEIESYKELTDAQIEALKAAKDLHDYQELIAEKTKSITDLERQIAAMRNDDTASAIAKRKLLEEQLAESRKELEEAQYDHSIEEQENALTQELEN